MDSSRLKILLLTHRFPYPPDKGERIRGFHWLKALGSACDVTLLALTQEPIPDSHLQAVESYVRRVRVVNAEPMTKARCFLAGMVRGCSVTESYFGGRKTIEMCRELMKAEGYDVCLAVCGAMGAVAMAAGWQGRLIVDLVDADSAKWRLFARHHRGVARWVFNREGRLVANLERRLAERAEQIITVSRRECELLHDVTSGTTTRAIPNGVDTEYFKPPDTPQPTNRLVFVGQMDYFPNEDAVLWFAQNVWPRIVWRHPEVRWNIVGRNPTAKVQQLSRMKNVSVTGSVPDVRPYLVNAVAVAPLRVTCGVQNKVLEALAAGRPVVATRNVAEAIDVRVQEELLAADTVSEWVAAVDLVLTDARVRENLCLRARQAMVERFGWERIERQMLESVTMLQPAEIEVQTTL